jgi:hypothetical protein
MHGMPERVTLYSTSCGDPACPHGGAPVGVEYVRADAAPAAGDGERAGRLVAKVERLQATIAGLRRELGAPGPTR